MTGLGLLALTAQVGRILPVFALIVPFWLVWVFAGFRAMLDVWPALLVAGASFALPNFLLANFHGPWLAAVGAAIVSMGALALFLKVWRPKREWTACGPDEGPPGSAAAGAGSVAAATAEPATAAGAEPVAAPAAASHPVLRAWLPWIILSVLVFLWGTPQIKTFLDSWSTIRIPVPGVDGLIARVPPVVAAPTPEPAVFTLNWLSATGTGIFIAALLAAAAMGLRPAVILHTWWATLVRVRFSLLTVSAMLALGFVTRYAGLDATLGLAFARTGLLYPFFGTLLGWLGVALTGSDTSSNVLFGSLQKISAEQLGLSPTLMAAANSAGGVMGKMIDAQSIVVATTATRWYGQEGRILRFVFWHSLALAALVGLVVLLQAYVYPFTLLVVQ